MFGRDKKDEPSKWKVLWMTIVVAAVFILIGFLFGDRPPAP